MANGCPFGPKTTMKRNDKMNRRLTAAIATRGGGADVSATRHAGFARLEPLTVKARYWLTAIASDEASWDGDALVVELRYFPVVADAAIDAGLTFEREELPN